MWGLRRLERRVSFSARGALNQGLEEFDRVDRIYRIPDLHPV